MRYRFIILALAYGFLLVACYAQPTAEFQSVSGDFARSWLDVSHSQNSKPAENKSSDLWSWGGLPKGKTLVNGELMPVTNGTIPAANDTANLIGDTYIDPYTGELVYNNQTLFAEPDYGSNSLPIFGSNDLLA